MKYLGWNSSVTGEFLRVTDECNITIMHISSNRLISCRN